jgi:nucleotide-binding universal stress UspA family protein
LNAVERFMTGSVASYVIKEALCDVLIVHPSAE